MSAKERMREFLRHKGLSKYKFYDVTGFSNGFLDKGESITSDKCEIIYSHYPEINLRWLITGEGSMLTSPKAYKYEEQINGVLNEPSVPLVTVEAIAGMGQSKFSIGEDDIQENYRVPDFTNIQFMIRVQGSSMYPKYTAGDIVACRILHEPSFIQWNKVHVIATQEQGILIKRVKKSDDPEKYLCLSDNKEYDPFEIPREELTGIALVVGVIRVE